MHRPTSVTIFGVVNIAFGVLGFIGFLVSLATSAGFSGTEVELADTSSSIGAWAIATNVLSLAASFALLASGIGLLRMRPWGRLLAICYAWYAILSTLLGFAYSISTFQAIFNDMSQSVGAGPSESLMIAFVIGLFVLSVALSLLHPVLLWYFMTRPHVAAAFSLRSVEPESSSISVETVPHDGHQSMVSNNPYAAPATTDLGVVRHTEASEKLLESVIPIKNSSALVAYYLGLFSLMPLLGLPLAIAAVVLGHRGLKNVRSNPEVRGSAHAWIGVICGYSFGFFNIAILCLIGVAILRQVSSR